MSIPRTSRPVSELEDHELGIEYHRLEFRWMLPPDRDWAERIRDASRMDAIREERARRRDAEAARTVGNSAPRPSTTDSASAIKRPANAPERHALEFRGGKVVKR